MIFFIDTADLEQIKEAHDLGVLDGVTTNPSLMAKAGITGAKNIEDHYKKIASICLLYTSPSPRDATLSRMPSSA